MDRISDRQTGIQTDRHSARQTDLKVAGLAGSLAGDLQTDSHTRGHRQSQVLALE